MKAIRTNKNQKRLKNAAAGTITPTRFNQRKECNGIPRDPFLESPETFRTCFGWHKTPFILKKETFQAMKLCDNFVFSDIKNMYYVHRVILVLCFRVSSFKPNNVAYIPANKLKFTVVELDSVYLLHLWPLCLKWISVSVGIDPPCCFRTESCFVFFPWIEGN